MAIRREQIGRGGTLQSNNTLWGDYPTDGSWESIPEVARRCRCSRTAPRPRRVSTTSDNGERNVQQPFVLTARLVLNSTPSRSPAQVGVGAVTQWPRMPGSDGVVPEMGRGVVALVRERRTTGRP